MRLMFLLFIFSIFAISDTGAERDSSLPQLRYFEILADTDISHSITKRGVHHSFHKYNIIKEVSFKALGRHFHLVLNPTQGLLSSGFQAFSVDKLGRKQPVWIDKHQFLEGHVLGEGNSQVTAYIDDGLITATVNTPEDTYIVEPSWRHLPNKNNSTMIVYRGSDVKYSWETSHIHENVPKFCSHVNEDRNYSEINEERTLLNQHNTMKRQAVASNNWIPVNTRCTLLLVADYRFLANMGGNSIKGTINFLISLIDRVNKIYLETEWKGNDKQIGFSGMGFVIKEVMVHTEPLSVAEGEMHYNMARISWDVKKLLREFSRNVSGRKYCLTHLFTDQTFDGRELGLGYVGSPRIGSAGGICSAAYFRRGKLLFFNSALSTSRNYYGRRVITREADLVTVHGHNWGSEHDPDIAECSPNSQNGGSYVMYTFSVSGYDPNNKKFSPCSIRSIRSVLLSKANKCFSSPDESLCGNLLVEPGEECDAGLIGNEDNDPCCDTNCAFRENVVCSDKNSPCCRGCQYVSAGEICRHAQPTACKQEAYCTGNSFDCPPSLPQPNNTLCLDRGQCLSGECVPFCETRGDLSCTCDREEDACKRCCRHSQNDTCDPVKPIEILRDGMPCVYGYCEMGECKEIVQDVIERFWDIVEHMNVNSILKFLNDNLVGAIIITSIIIWIPVSCVINYLDNKKRREYFEFLEKRYKVNDFTPFQVPSDESFKIVRVSGRPRSSVSTRRNYTP